MKKETEFKHAEAFHIMQYRCTNCGHIEKIWNSRDGVTPFMISCEKCGLPSQHIDWHKDVFSKKFKPPKGSRIFTDVTLERAKALVKKHIKILEQNGQVVGSKKKLRKSLLQDYLREPDLIRVENDRQ